MLTVREYRRDLAVRYARRYAMGQNRLFGDFSAIGGNCTNFVSQCLYAGSCRMNFRPIYGWFYRSMADRAPAWTGVRFFADFLTGNEEEGPFGRIAAQDEAEPGDVIQLADASGSYYHAMLIVGFSGGEPLVAAQSENSLDRPLSTYSYAFARFLHVEGVRADREETGACFDALYDGVALFPSS